MLIKKYNNNNTDIKKFELPKFKLLGFEQGCHSFESKNLP